MEAHPLIDVMEGEQSFWHRTRAAVVWFVTASDVEIFEAYCAGTAGYWALCLLWSSSFWPYYDWRDSESFSALAAIFSQEAFGLVSLVAAALPVFAFARRSLAMRRIAQQVLVWWFLVVLVGMHVAAFGSPENGPYLIGFVFANLAYWRLGVRIRLRRVT